METSIEKYNSLQKLIISDLTDQRKAAADSFINLLTCLGKEVNWNRLHHSIYVLEMGELAKKNFLQFGLAGPSGHPEVGGRYLRLFGLLSAVYGQKQAMESLLELYRIDEKEKISSVLNSSEIIELCHKLGAHGTPFRSNLSEPDHQMGFYEISRSDLEVSKIKLLIRQCEFESYDLLEDLKGFDKKVELTLSFMIGEILKKAFHNQGEYYDQYRIINSQKDMVSDGSGS
ncbi:hypothetical protein [Rufibacter psychrotolerans]|uniref:hypothetical protein n=1 Tax=Rufibacter psychrotolerans TaxID=2812556 RepID=UPI001967902D|nr:hypothetical protein [Rufibacter sp. SYSU D00308]